MNKIGSEKMKNKSFSKFCKMSGFLAVALLPVLLFVVMHNNTAKASLMITPLRAVFEGRDRSAVITLINSSTENHTYRMGWKFLRMTENGQYDVLEEGSEDSVAISAEHVSKMIRFSPRQVNVEAGGRQRIRLSLRKKAELPDGEYRAHLSFTRLPDMPDPTVGDVGGAEVVLHLNMAFSIPIIIKQGAVNVSSTIEGAYIIPPAKENKNTLSVGVDITRTGVNSTFGRIRIYGQDANGREKQIGILNNVALFPEITRKKIRVPLQIDRLYSPVIRIVYEGDGEFRQSTWDEKTITLTQ